MLPSGLLASRPKNKIAYIASRIRHRRIPMWDMLCVEIHSFCNRDCVWCPRYYGRSGIRKDADGTRVTKCMPADKVYDIIDQAHNLGYKGRIAFHRLSDSFLDGRFPEFYRYARSKGMGLFEATNGDVLRKNEELCARLDEPENRLIIGLYDCEDDAKRQREKDFWNGRFRKTEVSFSEPLHHDPGIRHTTPVYELAEKDPEVLKKPCFLYTGLRIRYDGNVNFCCADDQCTFQIGNVFEESLEAIWWSDKCARIIEALSRPGGAAAVRVVQRVLFRQADQGPVLSRAAHKRLRGTAWASCIT
jgi:MoaA/NifB/PqqE/SkfB family radical SAM enzyme